MSRNNSELTLASAESNDTSQDTSATLATSAAAGSGAELKPKVVKLHPAARTFKDMIDKNIVNINPVTKIVEPAFNKINMRHLAKPIAKTESTSKQSDKLNQGISSVNSDKKIHAEPAENGPLATKNQQVVINANPAIDRDKLDLERHLFVKEVYNKFSLDNPTEHISDKHSLKQINSEIKKGRKLRKEYTLPPKPVKSGNPFYEMEMKKYEAAKYYLINQNTTSLAKTCKKFKVSVPTLITYMDKARVDTFLKTGKYSATSAKREKRNVKNQYQEKNRQTDKWIETIKDLLKEAPSNKEEEKSSSSNDTAYLQDSNVCVANQTLPASSSLIKKEEHLAKSKQIMRNTELKLQNLISQRKNELQSRVSSNNFAPNATQHFQTPHQTAILPQQPTTLPQLRLPVYENGKRNKIFPAEKLNMVPEMPRNTSRQSENYDFSKKQSTDPPVALNFSRPSSSYYQHFYYTPATQQFNYQYPQVLGGQFPQIHNPPAQLLFAENGIRDKLSVPLQIHHSQYSEQQTKNEAQRSARKPSSLDLNRNIKEEHSENISREKREVDSDGHSVNMNDFSGSGSAGSFGITPPNSGTVNKDDNSQPF